jgi:hypothetical protein
MVPVKEDSFELERANASVGQLQGADAKLTITNICSIIGSGCDNPLLGHCASADGNPPPLHSLKRLLAVQGFWYWAAEGRYSTHGVPGASSETQ